MKTSKIISVLALGIAVSLNAQKQEDIKSIKAMEGCFEVTFNFAETFSPDRSYENLKPYKAKAYEYVVAAEESPNAIVLQHILVTNPTSTDLRSVVKHWRQDWLYENTDLYLFDKENHWKYKKLDPKEVKGQWSQIVYQVDDAPRYSATGTWVHIDGKHYWETNADAPLARREYTTRKDYNVLNRTNRQEIFDWGWLHNQDNTKILRAEGEEDLVIVEEKGKEYYKRTDDAKCASAKNYWAQYAPLWKGVREAWTERLSQNTDLYVKPNVEDTYLYMPLIKLKPEQVKEAKQLVKDYIVK